MPRIQRSAGVAWEGNLARGQGTISGESGQLDGRPIDQAARITTHAEGRTSPEELLATAHAGCFAMSLAGELTRAGTPPGKLDVRVTITLDGRPVAELRPYIRAKISAQALLERWRHLPAIDADSWRSDLDEVTDGRL